MRAPKLVPLALFPRKALQHGQHAGPSRRKLKINNPERYHWNPLQLLRQICSIYVQLSQGDAQGELARCIAADARCYRPGMFDEAAQACPVLPCDPCQVHLITAGLLVEGRPILAVSRSSS